MLCTVVLSCVGFAPQEAIHCCKTWFLLHISHIYICVCVGVSQNEVSFFPRKATLLEPKKDTSCWDIPRWVCVCVHIYIYIYMYVKLIFSWHALFFYPVLVCPIPKILYFFCMWFDSLIVSETTVSNQNMLHWKLQYRNKTWRKITTISKKKRLSI